MKRAISMLILLVGLACTYATVAAAQPSPEGPMPTCNPKTGCGPGK